MNIVLIMAGVIAIFWIITLLVIMFANKSTDPELEDYIKARKPRNDREIEQFTREFYARAK